MRALALLLALTLAEELDPRCYELPASELLFNVHSYDQTCSSTFARILTDLYDQNKLSNGFDCDLRFYPGSHFNLSKPFDAVIEAQCRSTHADIDREDY